MGKEVGQGIPYLVGLGDLFEFGLRFLLVVGVLVGVPSHGALAVGLLEVFLFGVLVNLEDFIVVRSHPLAFSSALRLLLLFFFYLVGGGGGVEWRMVGPMDLKELEEDEGKTWRERWKGLEERRGEKSVEGSRRSWRRQRCRGT